MATIKQFEDLEIWQKSRKLYQKVIALSKRNVFEKDFRFRSQIKAAAGSIMDNIVEGFERDSRLEFINFLSIAKGSCGEVKSQSYRALDEEYISFEEQLELMNDCKTLGYRHCQFHSLSKPFSN